MLANIKCTNCGTYNLPEYRFCKHCGILMVSDSNIAAGSPEQLRQQKNSKAKGHKIKQIGGTERTFFSISDPFASFGRRGRFDSWLLSNFGDVAEDLRNAVTEQFGKRQIPGTRITFEKLSGKGLRAEVREYYIIRHKAISVGLYISRFGKDLYISMVTYYNGDISFGKTAFLLALIVSLTIGSSAFISKLTSSTETYQSALFTAPSMPDFSDLVTALCLLGPFLTLIAFSIILFFVNVIYKVFMGQDPWGLLRVPPDEFLLDDIVALETAVEETVKQALDSISIDRSLLEPIPQKGWRERLI